MRKHQFLLLSAAICALMTHPVGAQTLPGTQPLTDTGDLAMEMVAGIDRYLMRELAASPERRSRLTPRRDRLREILGVTDGRLPFESAGVVSTVRAPGLVASTPSYRVVAVRWPVLPKVQAEGLLVTPRLNPVARLVVLPDAAHTPEMLLGLAPGLPPEAQFARRLAENRMEVLIPVLINREDTMSANPAVNRTTNQPHREFIHRMAYEMGRTLTGYEVQKVLAAVDWSSAIQPRLPIGVAGYGEGGLIALMAGALDARIDATFVSGHFQPREQVWEQPLYRNVWSLLTEFGDAEVASLVAPRALVIEASRHPEVAGPPAERDGRRGAATGKITTPPLESVRAEFARAETLYRKAGGQKITLSVSADGTGQPGGTEALNAFAAALGQPALGPLSILVPKEERQGFNPAVRHAEQFQELIDHTQGLVRSSGAVRRAFWSKTSAANAQDWPKAAAAQKKHFWEELMGRMPAPSEPLAAQSRRIYDEAKFTGFEVKMPVWRDVFAYGVLLLPKDLKPGERRPVVVAQHGLEGRPQDLVDPKTKNAEIAYARYAAALANRGFIVYAPQNPYIGMERFRVLMRKANPLKLSLFSFIIGQHERTLEWLKKQPFTDPARIAFYGLSYGGKTAMRVPALLDDYALSICSADFNEWVWKVTSVDEPFSYMYTQEYDMLEFNLGNTHNYAEMASMIAPRPFMVERGHKDGVGIDEWVALEYAKVRRFYTNLGIAGRTEIEFFDGPHSIHGVGTFEFLHKHLNWPKPQ